MCVKRHRIDSTLAHYVCYVGYVWQTAWFSVHALALTTKLTRLCLITWPDSFWPLLSKSWPLPVSTILSSPGYCLLYYLWFTAAYNHGMMAVPQSCTTKRCSYRKQTADFSKIKTISLSSLLVLCPGRTETRMLGPQVFQLFLCIALAGHRPTSTQGISPLLRSSCHWAMIRLLIMLYPKFTSRISKI